jgi:hypothetical protein
MKPHIDFRKQATSADVDGFINTLTLLLEGNGLSDSTKEILKQALCNVGNISDEGEALTLKASGLGLPML